jgi:hypothetical protein
MKLHRLHAARVDMHQNNELAAGEELSKILLCRVRWSHDQSATVAKDTMCLREP